MVGETSLDIDFENKLLKLIPGFFDNLPDKSSTEEYDSSYEVIQNFCYCKKHKKRKFNKKIKTKKL